MDGDGMTDTPAPWTPGPWEAEHDPTSEWLWSVKSTDPSVDVYVALLPDMGHDRAANARAIAEVPTMIELLEQAETLVHGRWASDEAPAAPWMRSVSDVLRRIRGEEATP